MTSSVPPGRASGPRDAIDTRPMDPNMPATPVPTTPDPSQQSLFGEGAPAAAAEPVATKPDEPTVAHLYAKARELRATGDRPAMMALYKQILSREPTHVGARNNLALLLEQGGKSEQALEELGRALQYDPNNVSVLCNRAAILGSLLRYELAEQDLRRALQLDEANAEVLTNLGMLLCRKARWREAVEPLRRAVEIEPDRGAAH